MSQRWFNQQLIGLISICFLFSGCSQVNAVKSEEDDESKVYSITPIYEVEDYRFVADGNGIIIDWKVANQVEINLEERRDSPLTAANKNYLIRTVYKERDRFPGPTIKEMEVDEYRFLDVYDLRTSNLEKKRIDLVQVLLDYLKDDGYRFHMSGGGGDLFQIGDSNYTYIGIGKGDMKKSLILNIDTGLIEGEAPYITPKLTNYEYLYLDTYFDGLSQFSLSWRRSGKSDFYDGSINLKDADPQATVLLDQEDAEVYPIFDVVDNTIINQEGIIAMHQLFMNRGLNFYDLAYLDGLATIDGEDHRITKFEDIAAYAKKPEEYDND
ncbi:hypothetical protein HO594_03695 [Streptococcus suis]|nr:hypothetical protein [Streptococcus suis]